MKTLKFLLILIISVLSPSAFGQQNTSSVWVTVEDVSMLPVGPHLTSSNTAFQSMIESFQINSIQQVAPASKNQNLLKVYELTCDCNEGLLIQAINNSNLPLSKPEHGPEFETLYTPNDYTLTFATDYALNLINAEGAWENTMGTSEVEIAILDTKYDLNHEELQNTVSFDQGGYTYPNHYHGTAVATIAAGNTDNGLGKSSIGSNCNLQLYKIGFNEILMATYNGAKVINLSWSSGCGYSNYQKDIIQEAVNNGSIVVAAAGNGSTCGGPTNLVYPSAYSNVISVTSVGPFDNHERTIGDPATTHQHNPSVDIAAPGYDVGLTVSSGWYLTGNGTSFASPYVAGTIGLMLSVNPCLSFYDVKNILQQTAVSIDSLNPSYAGLLGAGRLDASAAVAMAADYETYTVELTPTFSCLENGYEIFAEEVGGNMINYTTLWSNGLETETVFIDQSGYYTVTMTDENGCSGSAEIQIELPELALEADAQITSPTCYGNDNGEISLSIMGGFEPYSVQWSTGETEQTLSNLVAGTYEVFIQDSMGCNVQYEYQLFQTEALEIQLLDLEPATSNSSGLIDIEIDGGTEPYTVLWSNGTQSEDLQAIGGDYDVTVIDANGCQQTNTFTLQTTAHMNSNSPNMLSIFPNPSNQGSVTIQWNDTFKTISIFNVHGQVVREISILGQYEIDLNDLTSGVYFIQFDNQSIENEKIIVL